MLIGLSSPHRCLTSFQTAVALFCSRLREQAMCRPIELRFWTTLGTRRISVTAAEAFALTRQPIGHTPSDRWASDFKLATHYNAEFPGEAPVGAKLAETTRVKPGSGTNID